MSNLPAKASVGLAEIFFETPGGHTICDCDPYLNSPVLIGQESSINLLEKWYFYNNHIVGQGKNYYFIFNEATTKLQYFRQREAWENAVIKQHLEPHYTRWLTIDDAPELFYSIAFLSSFVIGPLLLVALFVVMGLTMVKAIVWNRKVRSFLFFFILVSMALLAYRLNIRSF